MDTLLGMSLASWIWLLIIVLVVIVFPSIRLIGPNQVGLVIKRFSVKKLPALALIGGAWILFH